MLDGRPMDSIRRCRASSTNPPKGMTVLFFILFLLTILVSTARPANEINLDLHSSACNFPAFFNFGDSNSDTGGMAASFHPLLSPYGDTFFGKPSGRYNDGRLVVDFIAEALGLPFLSPYLDSMGTNYHHGANFAVGGATIQPLDTKLFELSFSPFSLDVQVSQFEQFKARTNEIYTEAKNPYSISILPQPEDFAKALYVIDIGQNDLRAGLKSTTQKQLIKTLPHIINLLVETVEKLYGLGGRAFWIHNSGPIGCLPDSMMEFPPKQDELDQHGCIKSLNEVAAEFNKELKEKVSQLRFNLSDAMLAYVDMFSVKYNLISEASKHGFVDPFGYCCGHGAVRCSQTETVNGTQDFGGSCSEPSRYISWDSVHYTDAACRWIATAIFNGSFSDPKTPITEACHKPLPQV